MLVQKRIRIAKNPGDNLCLHQCPPSPQVDAKVLDLPGVIIADRNAASDWVRFSRVGDGLKTIDRDRVFARYWTHPENVFDEMSHKSEKCAEVLVPDCVLPGLLVGAYVANEAAL